MVTETKITNIIQEYLKGSDKFLIEVLIKPINHIMVFIDGDHGVTIDDCQTLSRLLEQKLDRDREDFDLMVSSAGADRPLQVLRQYRKYLGKELDVITNTGNKISGKLLKAEASGINIELEIKKSKKEIEKKTVELKYDEIKSAKTILSFKH
jgi:ribosome maturation factor RimP